MNYVNNIQGWMSEESLQWLLKHASEMDNIVEIGCWMGRSTHALLTACKGTVNAVDHFRGNLVPGFNLRAGEGDGYSGVDQLTEDDIKNFYRRDVSIDFLNNVGMFPNLKLFKMSSLEASKFFQPKSVDMVFIDGEHTYIAMKQDLEVWTPVAKKLICGHDYNCYDGIKKAVHENFGKKVIVEGEIWFVQFV